MTVIYLVSKWCWSICSDLHRQYTFGEHSPLPAIFLFSIAMHDKHLVHETATLSILDSNVDFESHAIIDSRHTTTNIPQAPSLSTLSALISVATMHRCIRYVRASQVCTYFGAKCRGYVGPRAIPKLTNLRNRFLRKLA